MEENNIFGDNVSLPSLPGIHSECEEEILLLMKEVDNEFQRKHHELLSELRSVRSLCREQKDEIENLRRLLMPNEETTQSNKEKELIKKHSSEIEKLKKERNDLLADNHSLRRQIQKLPENVLQLDSLKRSLSMQQDENKALKDRLLKVNKEYDSLQGSYQRLMNVLATHRQNKEKPANSKIDDPFSQFIEEEISGTAEKFISEDRQFVDEFQLRINQEINDLERKLSKEGIN